jgi:hypothetical protein
MKSRQPVKTPIIIGKMRSNYKTTFIPEQGLREVGNQPGKYHPEGVN